MDLDFRTNSDEEDDPPELPARSTCIPDVWLHAAARLKPCALAAGVCIWQRYQQNDWCPIPFPISAGMADGLSRDTTRHGRDTLEREGLLKAIRKPRKAIIVEPMWRHLEDFTAENERLRARYVTDLTHLTSDVQQGDIPKFGVVYADPPWQYDNSGTRGNARKHYPCQPIDWIKALPTQKLVASRALCWLWTTTSFKRAAYEILESWGFTYKSEIVWNKQRMGLGNYARVQHETLLIGSRGGQMTLTKDLRSVIEAKPLKHSVKPDVFRKLVEENSPAPRLELFARGSTPGWTCFGDEPH